MRRRFGSRLRRCTGADWAAAVCNAFSRPVAACSTTWSAMERCGSIRRWVWRRQKGLASCPPRSMWTRPRACSMPNPKAGSHCVTAPSWSFSTARDYGSRNCAGSISPSSISTAPSSRSPARATVPAPFRSAHRPHRPCGAGFRRAACVHARPITRRFSSAGAARACGPARCLPSRWRGGSTCCPTCCAGPSAPPAPGGAPGSSPRRT